MATEIEYIVNNPTDRKPLKVRIHCGIVENVIHRDEVKDLDEDEDKVKLWLLLGLSKEQVKAIVGFLRS